MKHGRVLGLSLTAAAVIAASAYFFTVRLDRERSASIRMTLDAASLTGGSVFFDKKNVSRSAAPGSLTYRFEAETDDPERVRDYFRTLEALLSALPANYSLKVTTGPVFFEFRIKSGQSAGLFSAKLTIVPPVRKVAVVIDDVGYSTSTLKAFLDSGLPFTYAVLPGERKTSDCVAMISASSGTWLVHLPMEPHGYPGVNPGRAALLLSMKDEEITRKVEAAFSAVPGSSGVNNHMGSAFTEQKNKMLPVMDVIGSKNLFYLDSRTSLVSRAAAAAADAGVQCLANEFFIDNESDYQSVRKQFERILRHASRRPSTVAIGHIGSLEILRAMKDMLKEYEEKHVSFVLLPELLR